MNTKIRSYERKTEIDRSHHSDLDEDRCRMEAEDIEYSFSLDWYDEIINRINQQTKKGRG